MIYNEIGDSELVYLIRCGNVEAKEFLISRYKKRIYGIVNSFAKRNNLKNIDYEDFVHESFIVFFKCLQKYDENYNFYTYVSESIERKLLKLNIKENAYRNILSLEERIGSNESNFINESVSYYNGEVINEVIRNHFDDLDKKIILLRIKGYNYNEIADILGVNKKKIYTRSSKIKQTLTKRLDI